MKILIRTPNWLGDAVFNLPFIEQLSKIHEITVVTRKNLAELFVGYPLIVFEKKSELYRKHLCIKGKYDVYIVTPLSFSSALAAYLSRAKTRIGFSFDMRDFLLTKKIKIPEDWKLKHTTETYAHLYADFIPPTETKFSLNIPEDSLRSAEKILEEHNLKGKPFVTIAPFAQFGRAKEWGEHNYLELSRLLEPQGIHTIVLGSKGDISRSSIFEGKLIVNLAGKTSLWEAASLAKGALAFVGGDSGLTHLASLCGARTVAIFGPTPIAWTRPLGSRVYVLNAGISCSPCEERECPLGTKECMNSIKPEAVFEIIRSSH